MKIYLIGAEKTFLEKIQKVLNDENIENTQIFISKEVTPEELLANASDSEVLVASPSGFKYLSKEHMESMPHLKLISTTSVGTDWVDIKATKELGITVSNQKGVNSEAVAEHCFGMILDLSKKITEADRDIREGSMHDQSKYTGINIYGRTLGIIGPGDIGKIVARIAGGFSMRVIATNKNNNKIQAIELVDMETLLKESDIIVVSIPLTDKTADLLSSKEFNLMKKGVILVSISREKIINKDAVLEAIKRGDVAGFGFDADITIPITKDDPWLSSNRIIVTPHTASITEESEKGYATMTVENIKAFLEGKPIRVIS
jgi:lactate dehydrogenase-like 2-hydroxyacid dehydrogenase